MKILLSALLLFASVSAANAQTVSADSLRVKTPTGSACIFRAGTGSPEGNVVGNPCDEWTDASTGLVYKKITGVGTNTGWLAQVGPTAATCTTFAGCVAAQLTLDTTHFTQQLRTDPSKKLRTYVEANGARIESFNASGWAPLRFGGGPTQFLGGGLQVGQGDILDPGVGNVNIEGYIGKPGFVSQVGPGWRIDGLGAADFRYLYTDELHAKKFIADLEQALAGLQIIAKSVGQIGLPFTVPGPGNISTLTMRDLPSASNMAIFESGDTVWVRTFSRAGGGLTITDAYGKVTSYLDLADGLQQWQFTRLLTDGGAMTAGTVVEVDSIVLDVGVSGNGWVETNAIDGIYGVNSPYTQIVTWSGESPLNKVVRVRTGNLRGITGTPNEYGLIAGDYAATNGRYFIASNFRFELHNIDLSMWNGTTKVISLERTTPYMSMGSPAPTSYSSGSGCWSGLDAGVFKWRCGNPAGHYIDWNGSQLTVNGNIVVTGTSVDASSVNGVAGTTIVSGAQRALLGLTSAGNPALPAAAAPSGSGLFIGSDYMGYYSGGVWQTFMTNTGGFYLGGTGGALQWNGTTLTISGTLAGNGSGITSIVGGNINTGSITATQIADGTVTGTDIASTTITGGNIVTGAITAVKIAAGTITGDRIAAGTITGTNIQAGTISATEIAAASITGAKIAADTITTQHIAAGEVRADDIQAGSITADKLAVTTLSAITANLGNVTAGNIVVGSADKLWLNDAYPFAVGGSDINTAGFQIQSNGYVYMNQGAYISTLSTIDLVVGNVGTTRLRQFEGGGPRYVCVDNSGYLYASAGGC